MVWLQVLQNLTELHITMLEITVTPSVPELPHPPTQHRMCQFKYACRVVTTQLRMYSHSTSTDSSKQTNALPYKDKTFYIDNWIG